MAHFQCRWPRIVIWGTLFLGVSAQAQGGSGSKGKETTCPRVEGATLIQSHFQLLQHAATLIPAPQEKELRRLFVVNRKALENFSCYFQKGNDPAVLSDVLSVLKLQILHLRFKANSNEAGAVAESLLRLRQMSAAYLGQPSLMARRLGASVRSLLLDELERMLDLYPQLVREEIRLGYWRSDLTLGIELEIQQQWLDIKEQFKDKLRYQALARHFGYRPWRPMSESGSHLARLFSRFKPQIDNTLEKQLLVLFKANAENFDLATTERFITHYLKVSLSEIRKNNYFIMKPWLEPVIEEKIQKLKSELGVSHTLIFPLVGVDVQGPFREIDQSIELLDAKGLAQARTHYARVKNPLGRLYEIVFLKRLTQMWAQVDIVQLRSDLNRVAILRTLLAVQDYQKRFARWPSSVEELVQQNMIPQLPKDYFTGQPLRYDSGQRQIWSVGENGVDEKGRGDDLSLTLSL